MWTLISPQATGLDRGGCIIRPHVLYRKADSPNSWQRDQKGGFLYLPGTLAPPAVGSRHSSGFYSTQQACSSHSTY